jgi:broad specificity phosphatase PhoE
LGGRNYDDRGGDWEDQSDAYVELGEIYAYDEWTQRWKLGILEAGESEQEIYERMLLVACHKTGASERWGREVEVSSGEVGTTLGRFAMGVQL